MGPYSLKSEFVLLENGRCEWHKSLPAKKVKFPTDIKSIPDMIVYFVDDDDPE